MKNKLLSLFTFLIITLTYSQSKNIINIDSTQIRLIGNKIYKAHQGYEKKDGVLTTSFRYSEIDLSNILFKTSKSELLPKSYNTLDAIFILLRDNSHINLQISGHTDKIGDSNKNLKLSIRRARAIRLYLYNKGIKLDRITASGYGEQFPVCDSPCKENQRVEFKFIHDDESEQKLVTRLAEKRKLAERNAKRKKQNGIKN